MKKNIALLCLLFIGASSQEAFAERPNVIVINIDNHSKFSSGFYGNEFIETPNIDRLFREGVRFDSYFTAGRCTGARSALLTGRYHARNGVLGTGAAWGQTREDVTTLGHVFADNGYQTAMFGKWHVGDSYPLRPEDRGFQEVVSIENGGTLRHVVHERGYIPSERAAKAYRFRKNGSYEVFEGFRTDIWFSELDRYVSETRDPKKPFFVYLATVTAHGPHYGPEDLRDHYKEKYAASTWDEMRNTFEENLSSKKNPEGTPRPYDHAADIGGLDRNIGRMMAMLEREKVLNNTIIMFTSDGQGGGAATLSKTKQKDHPAMTGVPMVVRLPDLANQGTVKNEIIATIDVLPTVAELAGIKLDATTANDINGQSFAGLVGVPHATPWEPRTYIWDQQSTKRTPDINHLLTLHPNLETKVFLSSGEKVEWRSGEIRSKQSPEVNARAEAAYKEWVEEITQDMPLGAFVASGPGTPPVFMSAYPILNGPAGEGRKYYYLLDIEQNGRYEFASDTEDKYGLPRGQAKTISASFRVYQKTTNQRLPMEFDEEIQGFRVPHESFQTSFMGSERTTDANGTIILEKGRYLFHRASTEEKRKAPGIRVEFVQ